MLATAVTLMVLAGVVALAGVAVNTVRQGKGRLVLALLVTCYSLVIGALLMVGFAHPAQAHGDSHRPIQPCQTDEVPYLSNRPCVWDARHMGNGQGTSFVVRKDGRVQHVSHHFAHGAWHAWMDANR